MKFIFGLIGAIVGALMGELVGALIGMGVGIALASMIKKADGKPAEAPTKPPAPPVTGAATAPATLDTRVARLEREVQALREEVRVLKQAQAGPAVASATTEAPAERPSAAEAPSASTPPMAPALTPLAPAVPPQAEPRRDTAPAVLVVPLPRREPAPEPDPSLELELDLSPLHAAPAATPAGAAPVPLAAAPVPLAAEAVPASEAAPAALNTNTNTRAAAPAVAAAKPAAAPPRRPAAPPPPPLRDRLPPVVSRLIFGGNTIVKIGALILFMGLAFLLRLAAEHVTVPVELRYAGVALVGAVLLGLGWRLRRRADGYGVILQGAGVGVFYLTTLAALKISELLPAPLAFGFLFAVAVLSAVLAVAQNAQWLAYVAAAEGFAAPVLVSTGGGHHIGLFSYLAVLDVGIFLMAWFRAWRPLNLIGAVGTFTLAGAWAHGRYTEALYPSVQAFLLFFFVLFTLVGVLFARRALALGDAPDERQPLAQRAAQALAQVGRVDSTLTFGVPLAAYGLQYLLVRDWAYGPAWAALGFSLFYLLLGGSLLRSGQRRYSLLGEAYVIVSVIFGTLAIPLALEGQWTGATWAVEAAGMYWLGQRQQRRYARAFALLVLAGATVRLASAMGLDFTPGTPLLTGSGLSLVMLAVSAMALFLVARRQTDAADWEQAGRTGSLWVSLAAVTALFWWALAPLWASVATALFALACSVWQARAQQPALQSLPWAGAALHAVALAGFGSTLHRLEDQAMLSSGWPGLLAATLIGGSLLATAWLPLQAALRAAQARQAAPQWSLASSLGLLAGVALLSLSLLFVMPADRAALVWPWLGLGALWLGLRIGHPALAIAWCWLQWGAAFATLAYGEPLWADDTAGLTLWGPLTLTAAGLLAGDWLQRAARSDRGSPVASTLNAWLAAPFVQWGVVLWSLAWWAQVLLPEAYRHLLRTGPDWVLPWPSVLAGWVLLTSLAASGLARWRDWRVLGQTTWATLPAWAVLAFVGVGLVGYAPHEHLGWAVWPAAFAWHLMLLRQQPRWARTEAVTPLHVGGLWLFLLLAAREGQWWMATWGEAGSAWPALGWVLVPAAVLALLSQPLLHRRWPVAGFDQAYLLVASAPVAGYLLLWLWASNALAGDAAPLPYVPLLNPLEIGHGLVLMALLLWRRTWAERTHEAVPRPVLLSLLGATGFALYTGMVLRTCHHWAGVPWSEDALFESKLTQAALSVAWAVVGVALMLLGHKRVHRTVWVVGAALLGVVVLKLFFVELADRGGLYRIVSFIVVGLLLLVVGYFAPVPPSRPDDEPAAPKTDPEQATTP